MKSSGPNHDILYYEVPLLEPSLCRQNTFGILEMFAGRKTPFCSGFFARRIPAHVCYVKIGGIHTVVLAIQKKHNSANTCLC